MTKRSQQWLDRHIRDPYVKKAQKEGYPSRAAYKLIEINQREKMLRPGMHVVDLGAAPGGWSMVAKRCVGNQGKVIAMDILPLDSRINIEFIQGDFTEDEPYQRLLNLINQRPIDLVISDMSPNLSGNKSIDQPRAIYLAEISLKFALQVLRPGGNFLFKTFHGAGLENIVKDLRLHFKQLKWRKPLASRSRSREIYLLALDCHHEKQN